MWHLIQVSLHHQLYNQRLAQGKLTGRTGVAVGSAGWQEIERLDSVSFPLNIHILKPLGLC